MKEIILFKHRKNVIFDAGFSVKILFGQKCFKGFSFKHHNQQFEFFNGAEKLCYLIASWINGISIFIAVFQFDFNDKLNGIVYV